MNQKLDKMLQNKQILGAAKCCPTHAKYADIGQKVAKIALLRKPCAKIQVDNKMQKWSVEGLLH